MNVFQMAPKGASPFSPDSVSGLVRWYNLRAGAAYQTIDTSGSLATVEDDVVGCVIDQVNGGTVRLSAFDNTTRPLLKTTSGPGGNRFLYFASGKRILESFTLGYPFTRFDVLRVKAGYTVGNYLLGGYTDIARGLLQPYPSGRVRLYDNGVAGPDVALTADAWVVVTEVFNATAMRMNLNNTTDATGAAAGGTAPNGYQIGDGTYPVPLDWVETLIYNVTVAAPDRAAIAAYLMSKYGVS